MLNGKFVIDAVAHAFNLTEDNFAFPKHARPITDMIYGVISAAPEGYRLAPEATFRDWDMADTAAMFFRESDTDVAVFHPTPIFAYKDGLSGVEKGVDALRRYPQRFIASYAAVDPLMGKKAFEDLERQAELLNPIGLKLYPTSWVGDRAGSWRMDDPKIAFPLYERAAELGIKVVAVHKAIPLGPAPTQHSFDPVDVDGAADAFPELEFQIVHGGAAFTEETSWLLARHTNVTVTMESLNIILANQPRTFAKILLGLLHVGGAPVMEKLYWATGTMQYHPRPCLDMFEDFTFPEDLLENYGLFGPIPQITDRDKANMLGLNYARAHGLDVEALKAGIKGDEFDTGASARDASPYSTTSVADLVVG
ncbi:amidohydrolase family protein [Acrocarpospora catenulata]|uniref:amidohydrolase family protein n=1 Tax=Acrocarpospora catenulata TaxID=2836182 RepID=UPI001BDA7ED3|nr:amidohydrolase family protein [Acrocarpospora catenulata]